MTNKRPKPEEIVSKLRQVEVLMGQGMSRLDAIRHIGLFSIGVAMQFQNAKITVFEPSAGNYNVLRKNLKANSTKSNISLDITCYNNAVANHNEVVHFNLGRSSTTGSLSTVESEVTKLGRKTKVACVNYKEFISDIPLISFLKCDIEAAEYDVILNLNSELLLKIKRIIIEVHPTASNSPADVLQYLELHNFMCKSIPYSNGCMDVFCLNKNYQ